MSPPPIEGHLVMMGFSNPHHSQFNFLADVVSRA
jgi:hypothetical protein